MLEMKERNLKSQIVFLVNLEYMIGAPKGNKELEIVK